MLSLGIDIGTTTLRAIASRVTFATDGTREVEILPQSPLCCFTPFTAGGGLIEDDILETLTRWIQTEQIPQPDIGTILFTGEAQRARNCTNLATRLTQNWEGLMSAQLNPEMESRIAAYGAGAVALSAKNPGVPIVHMDIGGGTTNFAWIENGEILDTACLDIGCRKWVVDSETGKILRRTRGAQYLETQFPNILGPKDAFTSESALAITAALTNFLFPFAQKEVPPELKLLIVAPWKTKNGSDTTPVLSLSGGITECLEGSELNPFRFGDLGPSFAQALITKAKAVGKNLHFSTSTGRATAMGVSSFGFQISGTSIHISLNFEDRKRNVPILHEADFLKLKSVPPAVAIQLNLEKGSPAQKIKAIAKVWNGHLLQRQTKKHQSLIFLCKENLAKTFGYYLTEEWTSESPQICVLDEVRIEEDGPGIATLDLLRQTNPNRFAVIIKKLRLF